MNSPLKGKPRLGGAGLRKLTTGGRYHVLDLLQVPFGLAFWWIEQAKARIQDQVENERNCE
jgi:hypothetical protein